MYSALDLSKYIVAKCIDDEYPITNLQLQKILYYIQRDFLNRGDIAFPDNIEAWQFGPVVPNVYYHYCGFGSMPISFPYEPFNVSYKDKKVIDMIVEQKRVLKPWTMVSETHKINGAWDRVYKNGLGNHHVIPVDLIRAVG
jgi:uncharacterized phage-associated protein